MYKRNLDVDMISSRQAFQDGIRHDLFDITKEFLFTQQTGIDAIRTECPNCEHPTGVIVKDIVGKAQTVKCSWCKAHSVFLQTTSGNWKIKHQTGTIKFDKKGRHDK